MFSSKRSNQLKMPGAWPDEERFNKTRRTESASNKAIDKKTMAPVTIGTNSAKPEYDPPYYDEEKDLNIRFTIEGYMNDEENPSIVDLLRRECPLQTQKELREAIKQWPKNYPEMERKRLIDKLKTDLKSRQHYQKATRYTNLRVYMVKEFMGSATENKAISLAHIASSFRAAKMNGAHSSDSKLRDDMEEYGLKMGRYPLDSWDILQDLANTAVALREKGGSAESEPVRKALKDMGSSEELFIDEIDKLRKVYMDIPE